MKPMTYIAAPGALMPVARFVARFEREFQTGKYYTLGPVTERSAESHNLYFACVHLTWLNLPHPIDERFAGHEGEQDFRKWCLIKRGWCHTKVVPFETQEDADRALAIVLSLPTFVVALAEEKVLTIKVARTQKLKRNDPDGMEKKDFEASKRDVIEECCFWLKMAEEELVAAAKSQMVKERKVA